VGWVFMGVALIVAVCAWMAGWPFLPASFGGPETQASHFWSGSAREASAPVTLFLWSTRLHEVATNSLISCSPQYLQRQDRPLIESVVRDAFRNASVHCEHLRTQKLTPEQQELVLALLALVGEHSIQQVGLDVARAMQGVSDANVKTLASNIEQALKPNAGHLVQLRDALLPKTVQKTLDNTEPWVATLEPDNVRMMKGIAQTSAPASSADWGVDDASDGAAKHSVAKAGATEEVRLVLGALEELLAVAEASESSPSSSASSSSSSSSSNAVAALRGNGNNNGKRVEDGDDKDDVDVVDDEGSSAQQLRHRLREANLRCTAPAASESASAAVSSGSSSSSDSLSNSLGSSSIISSDRSLVDASMGEPLSCSGGDHPMVGGQQRQTLTLLCALRFGAQGFEALRAGPKLAAVALPDSAYTADGEAVGVGNIGFT